MRVRKIISLERGDNARTETIEEVFPMIGGHDLPDDERKLFGRFRANEFTWEDVEAVRAIVDREVAKPIPVIFVDARLQETWAGGERLARRLAPEKVALFISQLEDDFAEMGETVGA